MTNNVTSIIEANEEVILSMLNQDGLVDFCQIVPRRKDLDDAWGTKWNAYGQDADDNTSTRVFFKPHGHILIELLKPYLRNSQNTKLMFVLLMSRIWV